MFKYFTKYSLFVRRKVDEIFILKIVLFICCVSKHLRNDRKEKKILPLLMSKMQIARRKVAIILPRLPWFFAMVVSAATATQQQRIWWTKNENQIIFSCQHTSTNTYTRKQQAVKVLLFAIGFLSKVSSFFYFIFASFLQLWTSH